MKLSVLALLAASCLAVAVPVGCESKTPPEFFLAGDSTTAIGGGWGDGFLAVLRNGATGYNKGHNGATTASFVAGGDWATVLSLVKNSKAKDQRYVTIQFGHNDQKTTSNVTIAQFQANLETMAKQVRSAGATPIILTSLTRRKFTNGVLNDDLADVAAAAKKAAAAVGAALLDLNAASAKYIQAIGSANADTYNLADGDRTHLNDYGRAVFGRMVADLVLGRFPALDLYITPDAALSDKIARGVYA
ncbi:SGNH hydrolase-type esterase domain-containing protein [Staphylotrichum tortipilum]|uniref:SGNH hydrolase-type esterase domain-containing protein n=1 Tax=Staphylotrichum tortipilum TaxID=2831512 RepID=A0AAN6MLV1_9PEZI|nr:SGNH hydrolase-type esterase domain-containing protein [Staphylotrichum longicolle]